MQSRLNLEAELARNTTALQDRSQLEQENADLRELLHAAKAELKQAYENLNGYDSLEAQLIKADKEIADLRAQLEAAADEGKKDSLEAYARFGKEIIDQAKLACAEGSMGEEHEHQLELAAKLGAGGVRREAYDPAIHKPMDCDPGDLIWSWSPSPAAGTGKEGE
jgi:hypothetical protein